MNELHDFSSTLDRLKAIPNSTLFMFSGHFEKAFRWSFENDTDGIKIKIVTESLDPELGLIDLYNKVCTAGEKGLSTLQVGLLTAAKQALDIDADDIPF